MYTLKIKKNKRTKIEHTTSVKCKYTHLREKKTNVENSIYRHLGFSGFSRLADGTHTFSRAVSSVYLCYYFFYFLQIISLVKTRGFFTVLSIRRGGGGEKRYASCRRVALSER